MSEVEPVAVVRSWMEGVNRKDLAAAYEWVAPDCVYRSVGRAEIRGRENARKIDEALSVAFPDGHFSIDDLIGSGDKVAARYTFHGTDLGGYGGRPPTGRQVTMMGMGFMTVVHGRIVEIVSMADRLGMMQQLGVIPAPTQAMG